MHRHKSRREFLAAGGLAGIGALVAAAPARARGARVEEEEVQVAPGEDLMREHGLLNRILLIYDEGIRRLAPGKEFPAAVIASAAGIVRKFVEDYHEKLEEDSIFPRFEKAGRLVDLVRVLREQHQAGRRLTSDIQRLSAPAAAGKASSRRQLGEAMRLFIRMYRPHQAREDTILFPALHRLVSDSEYEDMGEDFEDRERQLFGEEGFERTVNEVAGLEKQLGIYDLALFTPKTT